MSRKGCHCAGLDGFDPDHPAHYKSCPRYTECHGKKPCERCDRCTWDLIDRLRTARKRQKR